MLPMQEKRERNQDQFLLLPVESRAFDPGPTIIYAGVVCLPMIHLQQRPLRLASEFLQAWEQLGWAEQLVANHNYLPSVDNARDPTEDGETDADKEV